MLPTFIEKYFTILNITKTLSIYFDVEEGLHQQSVGGGVNKVSINFWNCVDVWTIVNTRMFLPYLLY